MSYSVKLSEELAVVATLDPYGLAGAATAYTDVVNMANHRRAIIAVLGGTAVATKMAATAVTIKVFECTAAGTAATTALKTKAIIRAQTSAALGQQVVLEVRDNELGSVHAGYTQYFKVGVTAGTNAINVGVIVLAGGSRYSNAAAYDLATVTIV